ncbi:MAG TPA: hypothetical protein VHM19_06315, partial [Polyangiales bacterium]|nr:hypothetical protein [Polyangiales bacterium]
PLHVHLVGHSTGGVDANLLTHELPLGGGKWSDLDSRAPALIDRIRTVVSIGSPHQGACLARDPAARCVGQRDLRGAPALAKLLGEFALESLGDVELSDLAFSLQREGGKTFRFFKQVFNTWGLLNDLQPSRAWGTGKLRPGVQRRSFVTITGKPMPGSTASEPADSFFRDLSLRASGWGTGSAEEGELVQASVARLQRALSGGAADELLIKAAGIELPSTLDAGLNDGVVNSARQLMDPSDEGELAGIVVADHYDVVGYYDRHVWTVDSDGTEQVTQVISGLLHSGSGFRDNQFFELYRRVANVIAG